MNNRQLKFRVWDSTVKDYSYFDLQNITVPERLLTQHHYPVQQYTGKKDCYGKDLYEGDIIKYSEEEDYKTSSIQFDPDTCSYSAVVNALLKEEKIIYKKLCDVGSFEIIGNCVN
jgi:hypothetical protein